MTSNAVEAQTILRCLAVDSELAAEMLGYRCLPPFTDFLRELLESLAQDPAVQLAVVRTATDLLASYDDMPRVPSEKFDWKNKSHWDQDIYLPDIAQYLGYAFNEDFIRCYRFFYNAVVINATYTGFFQNLSTPFFAHMVKGQDQVVK